jgi:hypothetical protein
VTTPPIDSSLAAAMKQAMQGLIGPTEATIRHIQDVGDALTRSMLTLKKKNASGATPSHVPSRSQMSPTPEWPDWFFYRDDVEYVPEGHVWWQCALIAPHDKDHLLVEQDSNDEQTALWYHAEFPEQRCTVGEWRSVDD